MLQYLTRKMSRARQEPFLIGDPDVEREEVVVSEYQQPLGHQGMTVRTFMFNGAEQEVDLHKNHIHHSHLLSDRLALLAS